MRVVYEVWLETFKTGVATVQYEKMNFSACVKMKTCFILNILNLQCMYFNSS